MIISTIFFLQSREVVCSLVSFLFFFIFFFFKKWLMGTVVIMAIHGSQIILPYILCYDYISLFTLVL
jgi:hypothetical protein